METLVSVVHKWPSMTAVPELIIFTLLLLQKGDLQRLGTILPPGALEVKRLYFLLAELGKHLMVQIKAFSAF